MKILILISSLEGGGAERIASRVASALAESHEVHIMPFSAASCPYPISNKVRINNAGLFDLRRKSRLPFRFLISVIFGYFFLSFIRIWVHPDVTLSFLNKPNLLNEKYIISLFFYSHQDFFLALHLLINHTLYRYGER